MQAKLANLATFSSLEKPYPPPTLSKVNKLFLKFRTELLIYKIETLASPRGMQTELANFDTSSNLKTFY